MFQLTLISTAVLLGFVARESTCQPDIFEGLSMRFGNPDSFWNSDFGKKVSEVPPFVRLMLHLLLRPSGLSGSKGFVGWITSLNKKADESHEDRMNYENVQYRQYYYNNSDGDSFKRREVTTADCRTTFYVEDNLIPKSTSKPECSAPVPYKNPAYANRDTIRMWLHGLLHALGEYGEGAFVDAIIDYKRHKDDDTKGKHYKVKYVLVNLKGAETPKKLDVTKITLSRCDVEFYVGFNSEGLELEKGPVCDNTLPFIADKGKQSKDVRKLYV